MKGFLQIFLWPKGGDGDDEPDKDAKRKFGGNTEEFAEPGRPKTTRTRQTELSRISMVDQR